MEGLIRSWKPLLLAPAAFVSGCLPLPPPPLPALSELPRIEGDACEVSVARMGHYFGGYLAPTHVTVDSGLVATLKGHEYTILRLTPGKHTVGIVWRYWGFVGCGAGPGACGGIPASQLDHKIDIDCQAKEKARLGIERASFGGGPGGTPTFKIREVTDADADLDLSKKSFVVPRAAQ